MTDAPPDYKGVKAVVSTRSGVFCVLKLRVGQGLLYTQQGSSLNLLCTCEVPMGVVEHAQAAQITPWIKKGWSFLVTVKAKAATHVIVDFNPIKSSGMQVETKKVAPAPKTTVPVTELEDA